MVTIKRYFGKFKKPLHWRGTIHFLRYLVLPAFTAVGLMMAVRLLLVTQYAVEQNDYRYDLLCGDRVLVNRVAYGFKTPFPALFGHHCWGKKMPQKGDLAAFYTPGPAGQVAIDRITALPGDTVSCPNRGILPEDTYQAGEYIITHSALIGRLAGITYSVIPDAPFYRCLRRDRFLLKIDE